MDSIYTELLKQLKNVLSGQLWLKRYWYHKKKIISRTIDKENWKTLYDQKTFLVVKKTELLKISYQYPRNKKEQRQLQMQQKR